MCGIICYFGQYQGAVNILRALHLLEYRSPDSAGIAVMTGAGTYSVRRSVGTVQQLIEKLATSPLYPSGEAILPIEDFFAKQGWNPSRNSLRVCTVANGYTLENLYDSQEFRIGIGDRGADSYQSSDGFQENNNGHETGTLPSLDFDRDPVRHAFRLVGAHVANRAALDSTLMEALTGALQKRVPKGTYESWSQAWSEEVSLNIPGQAFAVAVRYFQNTFLGLSTYLEPEDWERFGGLTARAMSQIVLGHGRWAMVGAVTEENAHPFTDRSRTRLVCENGSHNASLLLGIREEQERWWRERGISDPEPVHRSQNTTEVIAYEWERVVHQIRENELQGEDRGYVDRLQETHIDDLEEQALRLTLWRLRSGNAHACAFHSRHNPGMLYVSSHHKPIAIITKETICEDTRERRHEIMVASDLNAALVLWPEAQVKTALKRTDALRKNNLHSPHEKEESEREVQAILKQFSVDVIFLDQELYGGEELLARIENCLEHGEIIPKVQLSRYDGTPLAARSHRIQINPSMVGQHGFPSYTEFHIAEIPEVLDRIVNEYTRAGKIELESTWLDDKTFSPGLNLARLKERFGSNLERLERLVLIGEGSSWRDAQAAAPLYRALLPDVLTVIYRPVELLNLGKSIDPATDLAVEISWSGTTDSLLKADGWFAEGDVLRLGITGRPQSDLGRRTAYSGGTLDVYSGVEVSVATVKGFEAILLTLDLAALYLASLSHHPPATNELRQLFHELTSLLPKHARTLIEDKERRARVRQVARRCRHYNKVAVIGSSPVDIEAELKIEELAQIVACSFDFQDPSLRALMKRSATVAEDRQRTLFILNATSEESRAEAGPVIDSLNALGLFCIVHTTSGQNPESWGSFQNVEVFHSPQVSDPLQPLVDALFFFDFAVAMAYGRGLSPREIDRPRNLAKSVTTTSAEKRSEVESRSDFTNINLEEFVRDHPTQEAFGIHSKKPVRLDLPFELSFEPALAVLSQPIPQNLSLTAGEHLVFVAEGEAIENALHMARGVWVELLGLEITIFRRFLDERPPTRKGTRLIRLVRAGADLALRDSERIALPAHLPPLELEMLATIYLMGLAVRLARERGMPTEAWECGLASLPQVLAGMFENETFVEEMQAILDPFVRDEYDKVQVIGGGQDFAAAASLARSIRSHGFMAEALYTDSAWHGPLATVGGPDPEHDTLIVILATDPLFQPAAMVDTQVYRTRNAPVILVVPEGNQHLPAVKGVGASAVLSVPGLPRPFVPVLNAAVGGILAREMSRLWLDRSQRRNETHAPQTT